MNNDQIDNTSYYRLPCGKYLEDFISYRGLDFAHGSALKYFWRAGTKDGESHEKDMSKCDHYVRFIADREGNIHANVRTRIGNLYREALKWKGAGQ